MTEKKKKRRKRKTTEAKLKKLAAYNHVRRDAAKNSTKKRGIEIMRKDQGNNEGARRRGMADFYELSD